MTPSLRRYHRHIWIILAILLPVLYVGAIMSIPKPVVTQHPGGDQPEVFPQVVSTVKSPRCTIRVRKNTASTELQLEVTLHTQIAEPEALVYLQCPGLWDGDKILVGKLSSKGTYRFPLTGVLSTQNCILELFNPFSNTSFETIKLQ